MSPNNDYLYYVETGPEINDFNHSVKSVQPSESKMWKLADSRAKTKEMAKKIQKYCTVTKSEFNLVPRSSRGVTRILVPRFPYEYEPELVLVHVGANKFEYRYHTLEDLYYIQPLKKCIDKQSSSNPKPPAAWCLECRKAFTKCAYANSHSKKQHQNSFPVYKSSYFVKIDH